MPTTYVIQLRVVGNIIVKTISSSLVSGDVTLGPGDQLKFRYALPFAFFLVRYLPMPRRGGVIRARRLNFRSPFAPPGLAHATDTGEIHLTVRMRPDRGIYTYALALVDSSGNIIKDDPQIIIN